MTDILVPPVSLNAEHLSFQLNDDFVQGYADKPVDFGFEIGGGNTLGELTFITKYSRKKADGTKERWYETCRRVVEGTYSILKDYCVRNRTPWNHMKAQRAAQDAYDRMFHFKWTPPGRGIANMGTEFVMRHGSAALQNCSFLSTQHVSPHNAVTPFVRMMEMSMLGVGVGFDTKGAGKLTVQLPSNMSSAGDSEFKRSSHAVDDSREGWCLSVELLLHAYLTPGHPEWDFDDSQVRPAGSPIRGLGGTAAGPGPLKRLHADLRALFRANIGRTVDSRMVVDIMNIIGKGVVSGNVRRSAQLALGDPTDDEFVALKDWRANPERMGSDGWGNLSNNSVIAEVGTDYSHLAERIAVSGEPGLYYLDLARKYGRLIDGQDDRDWRAAGTNPCAEQSLEDLELCTLVETYPIKHMDLADYLRTLKAAYLYAKAVTLLPTHWPDSNVVMQRNRRIGCSVSGIAQFVEERGWNELRTWLDLGYAEVRRRDSQYSEWLGVRESIKATSVKPSGTVSLQAGVTPGVHYPVADIYMRAMRFALDDPIVPLLEQAGYKVEPDVMMPDTTCVAYFPTLGPRIRTEREVSIWEKAELAALLQSHWADNNVSVTVSYRPEEQSEIGPVLRAMDGRLKAISFLSLGESSNYTQMPYRRITEQEFADSVRGIQRLDTEALYSADAAEAEGESFCTTDRCIVDR